MVVRKDKKNTLINISNVNPNFPDIRYYPQCIFNVYLYYQSHAGES